MPNEKKKKDHSRKKYASHEEWMRRKKEGRPKQTFVPEPYPGRLSSPYLGGTWIKGETNVTI